MTHMLLSLANGRVLEVLEVRILIDLIYIIDKFVFI
jgi:hypothetical protein